MLAVNLKLNRRSQGLGSVIGSALEVQICVPFHKPGAALRRPWAGLSAIGQSACPKFLTLGAKRLANKGGNLKLDL